ncbi:hypothetical protein FRC11_006763, partial [Ceratobasidium sp. 423]
MAAVVRAWRTLTSTNGTRPSRRRYLVPVLRAAKTAVHVFDVPVLRQSSNAAVGLVEGLKASELTVLLNIFQASKQNRVKAREQMDRIDQTIASVQAKVTISAQDDESRAMYLYKVQEFIDKLERGRFADQWDVAEAPDTYEKQFVDAKLEGPGLRLLCDRHCCASCLAVAPDIFLPLHPAALSNARAKLQTPSPRDPLSTLKLQSATLGGGTYPEDGRRRKRATLVDRRPWNPPPTKVARIADSPGLREPGDLVHRLAVALKPDTIQTPKRITRMLMLKVKEEN